MNHELVERLAIILAALELSAEELAAVVVEDCRNRGDDEADAERLRWEMARLIEPSPVGPLKLKYVTLTEVEDATGFIEKLASPRREGRCGAVSSLALGPSICQRVVDHDGPHVEADTSWLED